MSEHEEHEKVCKHKKVRYCKVCDVAFCRKCGREWGKAVWHYEYKPAVYPHRTWTGTFPRNPVTTTTNDHYECGSGANWAFCGDAGNGIEEFRTMEQIVEDSFSEEG